MYYIEKEQIQFCEHSIHAAIVTLMSIYHVWAWKQYNYTIPLAWDLAIIAKKADLSGENKRDVQPQKYIHTYLQQHFEHTKTDLPKTMKECRHSIYNNTITLTHRAFTLEILNNFNCDRDLFQFNQTRYGSIECFCHYSFSIHKQRFVGTTTELSTQSIAAADKYQAIVLIVAKLPFAI